MVSSAVPGITRDGTHELQRRWEPQGDPWATVVIVHGQGEHSGRYERTGTQLAEAGLAVRSFDLIGHGASAGRRGYIDAWSRFLDQIEGHVVSARDSGHPVVLLGHSTGSLMGIEYVIADRPRPDLLVASAPALHVADDLRTRLVRPILPFLAAVAPKFAMRAPVLGSQLSRDPAVGEAFLADPLVDQAVTMRYAYEYLQAQNRTNAHLGEISIPTLVLHGGSDTIVPPWVSVELGEVPGVERRLYPALHHEVLNEPEGPELVSDVIEWVRKHLAP